MRRWEEDRRKKQYKDKIRRAKPVVDTRIPATTTSCKAPSISLHSADYTDDPLKYFLKQYHIQQYYKKLIELGYQSNVWRLATLTDREVEALNEQLRLLPGHLGKFTDMLRKIRRVYISSRGRVSAWTAHSMSPRNASGSPKKFQRTLSHDSSGATLKHNQRLGTVEPSTTDRVASRKLAEELARAKIKIMLLEHELEQKTQTSGTKDSETPQNLSKKSITFNIEEEKPVEKPQIRAKKPHEEIGMSYDSSKMRSTLINIDVEEVCRCLAKAMKQRIVTEGEDARLESQQRHSTRQSSTSSLRYSDSRTLPNALVGRLEETFFEPSRTSYSSNESDIYNFAKNVLIRSKMEKEIPVILLVYLERLEQKVGLRPTNYTWKRLLFTCMLLASKVWDDDSYENKNFAEAFSIYGIEEINAMESAYLAMVDFELNVKGGEYAKAYFLLRTFFDPKNRSFPLKALDVETVRRLQSNAPSAETHLRDIHAEALFKTL